MCYSMEDGLLHSSATTDSVRCWGSDAIIIDITNTGMIPEQWAVFPVGALWRPIFTMLNYLYIGPTSGRNVFRPVFLWRPLFWKSLQILLLLLFFLYCQHRTRLLQEYNLSSVESRTSSRNEILTKVCRTTLMAKPICSADILILTYCYYITSPK